LSATVAAALAAHVPRGARVVAALSGGVDSVVLLHVLARLAAANGFRLEAMHVHHGLAADADRWAAFCTALGVRLGVAVGVVRVAVDRHGGSGIEAAARTARYAALRASGADVVALAHHRDDQAETLLLQLLRGAGVAGLAAMPGWQAGRPAWLRPLLDVDRAQIERYARAAGLAWVDDPANADPRFARNAMRHRIVPVLRELNPAAAANLARSAAHLSEAHALLDELARADLAACAAGNHLSIVALLALGGPRARNALRRRLHDEGVTPPSTRRLDALLEQLAAGRADGALHVRLDGLDARRFRDQLRLVRAPCEPTAFRGDFAAAWRGEREWPLPVLGGTLWFEPSLGEGLDAGRLAAGGVEVRLRRGGERLCIARGRPHRSLKNLFQEAGVPAWERPRTPLVYCGGRLVGVPGLGIDPAAAAAPGEPGLSLRWTPSVAAKRVIK
jgi:tRNA(Ile)-lysidine synthase